MNKVVIFCNIHSHFEFVSQYDTLFPVRI